MARASTNLVFVDLETTGLSPQNDVILEIAALPVDADLNLLDHGWSAIVRPILPNSREDGWMATATGAWTLQQLKSGMHERVLQMHTENGLFRSIEQGAGLSPTTAAQQFIRYCEQFVEHGATPIAGSSVHFDRRFLEHYMPSVDKFFHYRIADVSAVKEFWRRWFPNEGEPPKVKAHRALEDCHESVNEARWYKDRLALTNEEMIPQLRGH